MFPLHNRPQLHGSENINIKCINGQSEAFGTFKCSYWESETVRQAAVIIRKFYFKKVQLKNHNVEQLTLHNKIKTVSTL